MECINNIRAIQGKTVTTQGKIISCKIDDAVVYAGSGQVHMSYCTPTVRFRTNSGQEIDEGISVYSFEGLMIDKGETVTISYVPNHLQQAVITSKELWFGCIFDGGWGLLCFVVDGVLSLWRLKKRKQFFSQNMQE